MVLEKTLFYKSPPTPCGYLQGHQETKMLTWLHSPDAEEQYHFLLELGFRRSQTIMYKPICETCNACTPLRIPVKEFQFDKSQKRILKKNHDIYRRIASPVLQDYHYELYQSYMNERHSGEAMSFMSYEDVAMMVEETTIDTVLIEYYTETPHETLLTGWTISDFSQQAISMVYSVFHPEYQHHSLGTFAILDHILLARQLCLPYVYLGYWIKQSQKMSYKSKFTPHEIFIDQKGWILVE